MNQAELLRYVGYRDKGNRPQARGHLAAAAARLREMDMRFWLEEAEATLEDCR